VVKLRAADTLEEAGSLERLEERRDWEREEP
jgi:hypothetical protein